jgi:hypothetical protein
MVYRSLILFCGLGTSGKDYWAEKVMGWFAADFPHCKTVFVGISQARRQYWGKSEEMTDADHLLKNEITLLEVKKQFVIFGADVVVLNMTMLTAAHQIPFTRVLHETEVLLGRKHRETLARSQKRSIEEIPFVPFKIAFRAFWMTCDYEATVRRIEARQKGERPGGGLVTLSEFKKGQERFEPPAYYPYVKIDTSDESAEADARRETIIREYIFSREERRNE